MFNMLIPNMLFECIINEREMKCKRINIGHLNFARFNKNKTEEQIEAGRIKRSARLKKYWANMGKAKKEALCKKRAKSLKKYLAGLSEEEMKARVKPANIKLTENWRNPKTRPKKVEQNRKYFKMIHTAPSIEVDEVPRINDYSGVISMKDLESL